MAADKVWVEESNLLDLSEPEEFKIWLEHLDDPLVLLNTRDHLYNCFNLTYEQPSEGHPKMLKEAKRRISIDKEIVEVCTKELEQFYADQEVEHIIEQDDVIFRRVNSTYWKYPNELEMKSDC